MCAVVTHVTVTISTSGYISVGVSHPGLETLWIVWIGLREHTSMTGGTLWNCGCE